MAARSTGPCLGIVDWGIGGLGLFGLIGARLPALPIVYWSDTGAVPYGLQGSAELASRLRTIVSALAAEGCTEVVLACNAASTVVGRLADADLPVAGIIASGIAAVPAELDGTIGIVAGRRTVNAGAYRRALDRPGRTIVSRVAQPLSAHIEAGRTGTPAFETDLCRIVAPLRGADAVVLACTHYPAAGARFAEALPGTLLIDPARQLADELAARLGPLLATPADLAEPAPRTVLTTGDAALMRSSARAAWDLELPAIAVRSI